MKELLRNCRRLILELYRVYPWLFWGMVATFVVVSGRAFLQNLSAGLLVNHLLEVKAADGALIGLLGFFVFSQTLPAWGHAVQDGLTKMVGLHVSERYHLKVIEKKGQMDLAVIEDPANNDLFNKVDENVDRIQMFIERQFWIVQSVVEVALAAAMIFYFSWWMLLVLVALTVPQLLVEIKYSKRVWSIHGWHAEKRRRFWDYQGLFSKASSLTEIKMFCNVTHFYRLMRGLLGEFRDEQRAAERRKLLLFLLAITVSQIGFAVAAVYFVGQVLSDEPDALKVGGLLMVLASVGDMRNSLSGLFSSLGRQFEDSLFMTDIFRFLELRNKLYAPILPAQAVGDRTPKIEFQGVYFAYPNSPNDVLKDFNLVIEPGEKVAIVGLNGAGKTTIIKLLCRFYDPDEGRILIDGTDLRYIDINSWRAQLGVLFQEFTTYRMRANESIALGDTTTDFDPTRMYKAAMQSDADGFIREWPDRYHQQIGKEFAGGTEPSGGQKQKLALARVYYRQPNVLVLDEPTAAVDAEAEQRIFDRLNSWPDTKTVIFVSHRFSTVRQARRIVVVKDGQVTEDGPHKKLVRGRRDYARLFRTQAEGYK